MVECGVNAVEVEAGNLFFDRILHGVIEDGVNGRKGEIFFGTAAGEIDSFPFGVDEEAGVDGGFGFEIFDNVELALCFFDDVGAVFEIFGVFDGSIEDFAGFCGIEIGNEAVGVAAEGREHIFIVFLVAGGEVAAVGGGSESLRELF